MSMLQYLVVASEAIVSKAKCKYTKYFTLTFPHNLGIRADE